jgi:hypothetical protein
LGDAPSALHHIECSKTEHRPDTDELIKGVLRKL